jgi:hypothetical protein
MEVTCTRCHQAVPVDSCYCPTCGLPQIVYSSEDGSAPAPGDSATGTLRDASAVEWKSALRVAMLLAIPACLISGRQDLVVFFAFFWMAAAPVWAVTIYVRRLRPAWITMGAGARIGLVTGLLAGWVAFAATGAALYLTRLAGHGKELDDLWQGKVAQTSQQWQAMNMDAQSAAWFKSIGAWFLSAEGRAGSMLGGLLMFEVAFLLYAAVGGAICARLTGRPRRPEA